MKAITNGQPRELACFEELPARAARDFDYIRDDERYSARFVKYRGAWYDLGEFMRVPSGALDELARWDGMQADTYFSATLARYVEHGERVIIGRCYA